MYFSVDWLIDCLKNCEFALFSYILDIKIKNQSLNKQAFTSAYENDVCP